MERRRALKLFAGILVTAYTVDILDEIQRKRMGYAATWDFDTSNLSRAVTLVSSPWSKLFANGIVSHHPDWRKIEGVSIESYGALLSSNQPGHFENLGREPRFIDQVFAHMDFTGIQEVRVIGLNNQALQGDDIEAWSYGFQIPGQTQISLSSKRIPANERIRVLASGSLKVFGIRSGSTEALPITIEGPYSKHDPRIKHVRQF